MEKIYNKTERIIQVTDADFTSILKSMEFHEKQLKTTKFLRITIEVIDPPSVETK